jgi:hypothetical protein
METSKGFKGIRQNGRTIGSKNKTTAEIRDLFKELLERNLDTIQEDLEELEPKDRIAMLLQLSKFVIPQLRSIDFNIEKSQFEPIIFQFGTDDKAN